MRRLWLLIVLLSAVGVQAQVPPPMWYVKDRQWYNVVDLGAKGDSLTDDLWALRKADSLCGVAGGGIIFLPPGRVFNIGDSSFNITHSNTVLWGYGASVYSDTATHNGHAVAILGTDTANLVENCGIYGLKVWTRSPRAISTNENALACVYAKASTIADCYVPYANRKGIGLHWSQDIVIRNNTIDSARFAGITLEFGQTWGTKHLAVIDNKIGTIFNDTAYLDLCSTHDSIWAGSGIAASAINEGSYGTLKYLTITGNQIGFAPKAGIYLHAVEEALVQGNTIDSSAYGIIAYNSHNVDVLSNNIMAADSFGVWMRSPDERYSVTSNKIGRITQAVGKSVKITEAPYGGVIAANLINDTTAAGVRKTIDDLISVDSLLRYQQIYGNFTSYYGPQYLDVLSGRLRITTETKDSAARSGYILAPNYELDSTDLLGIQIATGSNYNLVQYGGGQSAWMTATGHKWYTGTYNSRTGTQRMHLDSAGRLGINEATPAYRLDVAGRAQFDSTVKIGAYTLPMVDGTANYVLKTDGSGAVSWAADATAEAGSGIDSAAGVAIAQEQIGDSLAAYFDTAQVVDTIISTTALLIEDSLDEYYTSAGVDSILDTLTVGAAYDSSVIGPIVRDTGDARYLRNSGDSDWTANVYYLSNLWASDFKAATIGEEILHGGIQINDLASFQDTVLTQAGRLAVDTDLVSEGELEDSLDAYSLTTHGHSLSDSLAKVAGDLFTGDVVMDGAHGFFHNDSTAADSAYVTKGYVDANDATGGASDTSLVVSLSGSDTIAFKWSANGDTLIGVDSTGNRFLVYHDGTQWVQDFGDGLTVVDSLRVNDYILFGDTNHTVMLDSARVDSMINLTGRYAAGAGSTDSFYVAESASTTTGWKQAGDTIFIDTTGGGGTGWNWADSSSFGPDSVLFADSANHADSATGAARATVADSAAVAGSVDYGDITNPPTLWDWADSSSHGPDSVLFADSSNHADSATGAARAAVADSAGVAGSVDYGDVTNTPTLWDWADSSSHGPDSVLFADSANHADSATGAARATVADSAGVAGAVDYGDVTNTPTLWDWADSSSHGPDSVLFADSANHADSATGAERATTADSAGVAGAVDYGDVTNTPTLWNWADSSSHGPDSVLFADSANHADVAANADRADTLGAGSGRGFAYYTGDTSLTSTARRFYLKDTGAVAPYIGMYRNDSLLSYWTYSNTGIYKWATIIGTQTKPGSGTSGFVIIDSLGRTTSPEFIATNFFHSAAYTSWSNAGIAMGSGLLRMQFQDSAIFNYPVEFDDSAKFDDLITVQTKPITGVFIDSIRDGSLENDSLAAVRADFRDTVGAIGVATEDKIGDWIDTTITDTIQYAKVADTARNIGSIGSISVFGNVDVSGYLNQWNWKFDLDTHNIQWRMPTTQVKFDTSMSGMGDSLPLHVSAKYRGTGWGVDGKKYHLAWTPYFTHSGNTYEPPCYGVTNHPGDTVRVPTGGHNPLWLPADTWIDINGDTITADFPGYFSDVHITYTFEDSIAVVYRGYNIGDYDPITNGPAIMPDTNYLFVTLSGDGVTWTMPQCIAMSQTKWRYISGDTRAAMGFAYLSPTVEPGSNGRYQMWTHEPNAYVTWTGSDSTTLALTDSLNSIMLWECESIRGPWTDTIGKVTMPVPNDSLDDVTITAADSVEVWHGSFTPFGPDQIIYIGNLCQVRQNGDPPAKGTYHHKWAGRYTLMMALSNDNGRTFTRVGEPMFWEKGLATYWRDTVQYPAWWTASSFQYRGAPIFINNGNHTTLGYFGSKTATNGIYYTEALWEVEEQNVHLIDPQFIHGNYADTSDLTNVSLKGPGFNFGSYTPYLWVDSAIAAAGTYKDTVLMQFVSPAYCRIESLFYSILTVDTSNIVSMTIIGPVNPGGDNDSGLGAYTYTNVGNYQGVLSNRWNGTGHKLKNLSTLDRDVIAIPVDSDLVFRQGDRFYVWLVTAMDAGEFVKCNQWQFYAREITPPKKDYYGRRRP